MTNQQLLLEIEKTRLKMCSLATQHPLFSKEMLEISKHLDSLLNMYQKKVL